MILRSRSDANSSALRPNFSDVSAFLASGKLAAGGEIQGDNHGEMLTHKLDRVIAQRRPSLERKIVG